MKIPVKRWILHSAVQNIVNLLPEKTSYKVYFYLQKTIGRLNKFNDIGKLKTAVQIINCAKTFNISTDVILELGTGRTITTLIGMWILGVKKMITIDINPYLSEELVITSIQRIIDQADSVYAYFQKDLSRTEYNRKISELSKKCQGDINRILQYLNIEYLPYKDAQKLNGVPDHSIDIYFSNQVLEHIPKKILKGIIVESNRVIKMDGMMLHFVGLHDHFATIDNSISKVNFLKYSDFLWMILAENRFMYHNRLRASDYFKIFEENTKRQVRIEKEVDTLSLNLIRGGLKINKRFANYSNDDLATTSLKIICKKDDTQILS